jgi:RNA polymerase subunit RPABC4/transcription elongation factor Spt4
MPTFKHPCPYCDRFIDRAVAACPFCGQQDPFAPRRCLKCRKIIEDPAWTVCPSCGQSLIAPVVPADGTAAAAPGGAAASQSGAAPAPVPAAPAAPGPNAPPMDPPPPPRPPLDPKAALPVLQSAGPCSGCGAPMPAGARFCTVCGTVAAQ